MNINIRCSTINRMLKLCKSIKMDDFCESDLRELLMHPDYQIEFERYENAGGTRGHFSEQEVIALFQNIMSSKVEDILNPRLRLRHDDLKYFIDHIDHYEEKIVKIEEMQKSVFEEAIELARSGLPDHVLEQGLEFIFSIGIGNSGGWFYKNCTHFDIIHFLKDLEFESINNMIAHEVHHIGFNQYLAQQDFSEIKLDEYLFLFLAMEGLAVKYCNNGEGAITKRLHADLPNKGLNIDSWTHLNSDFVNTYNEFRNQIFRIQNGDISTLDDLRKVIGSYWMCLDFSPEKAFMHSRNYSLGNDLWGVIHDVFGKEKVYATISQMSDFIEVLNEAFRAIGKEELCITKNS